MENFDAVIIGGGAAGMACAVSLAKNSKLKIAIVEAGDRLGKKIAATGNGQGNVSNVDMRVEHFHGGNLELVNKIACNDPYEGTYLFDCLFSADDRGRIYPSGRQASALNDCLISKLNNCGVKIVYSKAVKLTKDLNVFLENGKMLFAKYVVLCTGGKAQKQFKTDGSAYLLATALGIRLQSFTPRWFS